MTRLPLPNIILQPLKRIYNGYLRSYAFRSYSQEGEDMILRRFFGPDYIGFYVDVGAHHPRRFSNTCYLYKKGWHGINIEPNPAGHALLAHTRKRDINILGGVSDLDGTLDYNMFDEPALNTFDPETARRQSLRKKLVDTMKIRVNTLATILDKHMPANTNIDFINVDIEGHDLVALKSNDWNKYRARLVIAEAIGKSLGEILDSELAVFMRSMDYELYAKTVNSIFFRDTRTS